MFSFFQHCFNFIEEAKNAAQVLGYDERRWDKGKSTKAMKKYWSDLTDEERLAAEVLGYDQEMWDET